MNNACCRNVIDQMDQVHAILEMNWNFLAGTKKQTATFSFFILICEKVTYMENPSNAEVLLKCLNKLPETRFWYGYPRFGQYRGRKCYGVSQECKRV